MATISVTRRLAAVIPAPKGPANKLDLKYDAWNRLVEVKDHNGNVIQTNEYDGLNRRIVKVDTKGTASTGDDDTYDYYYNQQWQVVEVRLDGGSTPWQQYVYHPHYVDAVAMMLNSNYIEHYYLHDANFNVTAVVSDTGTVLERYDYTAYGEVEILDADFSLDSDGKSDIDNEYLYTGRRRDPATGLQLNGRRFYASHLGRWINRDPIRYWGSPWNLYEYVGGMPTYYVDPYGTSSWSLDPIREPRNTGGTRPGYRATYHPDQGECKCGRIKLVQAFQRKGSDPQFDIGPKGNDDPIPGRPPARYPGYKDTGFRGGNDKNGDPWIEDAPTGYPLEWNATICAVCEEAVPKSFGPGNPYTDGSIGKKETILSCINFEFFNFANSANDPRDGKMYPYWSDPKNPAPIPKPDPGGGYDLPGDEPGPPWKGAPDPRPKPKPYDPDEPGLH